MWASRWPALVVVLGCVVVVLAPWGGGVARPAADPPTVPDHIDGFSWRNADATVSPPGRAIALYADRFEFLGDWFRSTYRTIVVGASGQTYRWVPDGFFGGKLSPDGTMLAGSNRADEGNLVLLDLLSGHVEQRQVRGAPVAWFPDGRRLAYRAHSFPGFHDQLGVLDLSTGQTSTVAIDLDTVGRLAISPDGTELATQVDSVVHPPDPADLTVQQIVGPVRIYGMDGTLRRSLDTGHRLLQGDQPWSPDGRLLAVQDESPEGWPHPLTFLDATGHGVRVPNPVTGDRVSGEPADIGAGFGFVGWSATDRVVVSLFTGHTQFFEVPLGGGQPRQLSSVSGDDDNSYQMATGLLPGLRVYETGWLADRGPWPVWQRIVASLLVGIIATATIALLRRVRRRIHRRVNAIPGG